jgi:hypothetical protein
VLNNPKKVLMYIPRLDEFELKQIDYMIDLLDDEMVKLETDKMKAELKENEDNTYAIKIFNEMLDTYMLFKVQLSNARAAVENREKVVNS